MERVLYYNIIIGCDAQGKVNEQRKDKVEERVEELCMSMIIIVDSNLGF